MKVFASALCLAAMTSGAMAQGMAIPRGGPLDAEQLAHIFVSGCYASQPLRLEENAEMFELAFWFSPADAGEADLAYESSDWPLRAEVEMGALKGNCTLIIPTEGFADTDADALSEALGARIPEMARDSDVTQDADGWHWTRRDVAHTISLTATDDAVLLRHSAQR